jgi:hypothetical protein
MALAERVRIPCMRRAAERRGLVVAWRRRRRFGWEVPLGREEPPHAIPPSAPAATPHALDPLVIAALAPTAPGPARLVPAAGSTVARRRRGIRVLSPARHGQHERAPDLYLL